MPDTKLVPCPFCGVVPDKPEVTGADRVFWTIKCNNINCDVACRARKMGRARAIKAWNKRK